ncbi:CopD family protein [Candidatus Halobeggiatoa sp. HSG11]|nr:CopD family protein [Candidatus Halobeggiatoa sp. HSG11]
MLQNFMAIATTLHTLAVIIWIGGMFFAHMALRPVVASLLEPPLRLRLMAQVLERFFLWVWVAVILLWLTGLWMIWGYFGGMANVRVSIHIMLTLAIIMTLLYIYIFFIPFPNLKQAVSTEDFKQAGKHLARIRSIIGFNLILGLITVIVATGGFYL